MSYKDKFAQHLHTKTPPKGLRRKATNTTARVEHDGQPPAYWYAPKQEAQVGEALGADAVAGSGRGRIKGDCRKKARLRIECKATGKKSYSLKLEDWQKLTSHCELHSETPVMSIHFVDDTGRPLHKLLVCNENVWSDVFKAYATGDTSISDMGEDV